MDRSIDTACYTQQAGGLLLHCSKCFSTISVDPYDLVIFQEKGHICNVIADMLISTKPPLIPGINHFYFWSLVLASTMVRPRLERVATESSCSTELDKYNDWWLVLILYNIYTTYFQWVKCPRLRLEYFITLEICKFWIKLYNLFSIFHNTLPREYTE